jgi:hypothetical protein
MYKVSELDPDFHLLDSLKLLTLLLERTHGEISEEVLPVDEFFAFFVQLNPRYVEIFKISAQLCITLEKYSVNKGGVWLQFVIEEITMSADVAIAMAGYE